MSNATDGLKSEMCHTHVSDSVLFGLYVRKSEVWNVFGHAGDCPRSRWQVRSFIRPYSRVIQNNMMEKIGMKMEKLSTTHIHYFSEN